MILHLKLCPGSIIHEQICSHFLIVDQCPLIETYDKILADLDTRSIFSGHNAAATAIIKNLNLEFGDYFLLNLRDFHAKISRLNAALVQRAFFQGVGRRKSLRQIPGTAL
ncbi:MAG: hypothetical protein Q7V05_08960 [Methanoregula sp.]|nr:hypothetical protein [Methanoregula sp.]